MHFMNQKPSDIENDRWHQGKKEISTDGNDWQKCETTFNDYRK